MAFEKKCFDYEVIKEGEEKILKVHGEQCSFFLSFEDSPLCMSKIIDLLIQISGISRISISQRRNYEYDYHQTQLLNEIALLAKSLFRDARISYARLIVSPLAERLLRTSFAFFQRLVQQKLKEDPVECYLELKRFLRGEKAKLSSLLQEQEIRLYEPFVSLLEEVVSRLEKTRLISLASPYLAEHKSGERRIYRQIFHPTTRPDFLFTRLMAEYPLHGEIADNYLLDEGTSKAEITLFSFSDNIKSLYHLVPPEFKLDENEYELLDTAKRIMAEHQPTREEFVNPERMREVFYSIGKDLIEDLAGYKNLELSAEKINQLALILLRHTVGFGLIEVLLSDPKVQDVNINSPIGEMPLFLVHQDLGDCFTNIYPTPEEVEGWATRLRFISGRPLDEANPILDTELKVPGFSSRVAAITRPLNPTGYAFSFRRHRDYPWTFPLYLQPKINMFNSTAAGLLSFLLDNNATILVAGTRSSGKTSLLGSFLVEIMRKYRIITLEDTLELPTESLRKLGFNIQSLKVASPLTAPGTEVEASTGIRSTLRLGDSAIFIGEVRSVEAVSLYEAMRIGAAANVVAGTIHAASPYGVFDRVVNDIGVPKTSFKATDIIVIANPIKTASGIKRVKRVLSISEVRKEWEEDPLKENAFVDLMKFDPKTDQLYISDELKNGESEIIKAMASRIKEFAGDWEAVWQDIVLRGEIKKAIVDLSLKLNNPELLEAPFVIKCNDAFHLISEKIREEIGFPDPKRILFDYQNWLKKEIKKRKL